MFLVQITNAYLDCLSWVVGTEAVDGGYQFHRIGF